MSRLCSWVLAASIVATLPGCLLFTEPVNDRPALGAIQVPEIIVRGVPVTFRVTVTDRGNPSSARPTVNWFLGRTCPAELDFSATGSTDHDTGLSFTRTFVSLDPVCIWVVATDSQGAQAKKVVLVRPANQAPVALIDLVSPSGEGPFDLYSEIHVSGSRSHDADPADALDYRWTLTSADGRPRLPVPCSVATDKSDVCFTADQAGTFKVDLVVSDKVDSSAPAHLNVEIASDRPPCITATDPEHDTDFIVRSSGITNPGSPTISLSVLRVSDDGDPYPPRPGTNSQGMFTWSWRMGRSGPFNRDPANKLARFTETPTITTPGTELQVRVRYDDRMRGRDSSPCNENDEHCVLDLQPGQDRCWRWVTWTIRYQ